ncbi:MAG: hypothetical protein ACRDT7_15775 [Microbacterium sp.]
MKKAFPRWVAGAAAASLCIGAVAAVPPAAASPSSTGAADVLSLLAQHGVDITGAYADELLEVDVSARSIDGDARLEGNELDAESDLAIIEETVYTAEVRVPQASDGAITVDSEFGDIAISLPEAGSGARVPLSDRVSSYAHDDGSTSVPIIRDNGFQILTVVDDQGAPESYSYKVELDGGRMELVDSGAVIVFGAQNEIVGTFDVPWARDDNGASLTTRYTVEGDVLTQIVEHRDAEGVSYPVLADPSYSSGVLSKSTVSSYSASNPGYKVSAWVSAAGRAALLVDSLLFSHEGWKILKANHPGYVLSGGKDRPTMKQQWDCHVTGWVAEWGSFDLETGRSSNPNWVSRIGTVWPASLVCNW